jgi:hypothetical protein
MTVKTHDELIAESARLSRRAQRATVNANKTAQQITRLLASWRQRDNELAEARGEIPKGRGHLRVVT